MHDAWLSAEPNALAGIVASRVIVAVPFAFRTPETVRPAVLMFCMVAAVLTWRIAMPTFWAVACSRKVMSLARIDMASTVQLICDICDAVSTEHGLEKSVA